MLKYFSEPDREFVFVGRGAKEYNAVEFVAAVFNEERIRRLHVKHPRLHRSENYKSGGPSIYVDYNRLWDILSLADSKFKNIAFTYPSRLMKGKKKHPKYVDPIEISAVFSRKRYVCVTKALDTPAAMRKLQLKLHWALAHGVEVNNYVQEFGEFRHIVFATEDNLLEVSPYRDRLYDILDQERFLEMTCSAVERATIAVQRGLHLSRGPANLRSWRNR